MVISTTRLTLTPLATAADSDRPVVRRSKPKRVQPSRNQYADADRDREQDQAVDLVVAAAHDRQAPEPARTPGSAACSTLLLPGTSSASRSGVSRKAITPVAM